MNYIENLGANAKAASYKLQKMNEEQKNYALICVADAIEQESGRILYANDIDVSKAEDAGVSPAMIDRLRLDEKRISAMATGIRQIVELKDPVGEIIERRNLENGLNIYKVRVPMGVIAIIYESRPNVTVDAFGLCFKTGNAVILRGGSDAINSNKALTEIIRETLSRMGVCEDAVQLVSDTSRDVAGQLMKLNQYVDVLIPRGGAGLIRNVLENATVPVIETGTGNCHIYVDRAADLNKALPIIVNAKTQRMGVCNACESLLVHEEIAEKAIPVIYEALTGKNIEIRAEQKVFSIMASADMGCDGLREATEDDWGQEYLGPIISLKVVSGVDEAVEHINKYNTHHSEAIITEDMNAAEIFLNGVDAACVYLNASTRFTDGFEFGMGAEIGISTQKLHARGPMGLREMTTYKYKILGNGQVRG